MWYISASKEKENTSCWQNIDNLKPETFANHMYICFFSPSLSAYSYLASVLSSLQMFLLYNRTNKLALITKQFTVTSGIWNWATCQISNCFLLRMWQKCSPSWAGIEWDCCHDYIFASLAARLSGFLFVCVCACACACACACRCLSLYPATCVGHFSQLQCCNMSPHLLSVKIKYTYWVLTNALVASNTVRVSGGVCVCVIGDGYVWISSLNSKD